MDGLKPPIFLLGAPRSGTTLMLQFFDLHPQITTWFEPRTIWVYAAPGRRHDRFEASDATKRVKSYIRRRFLMYQYRHGNLRVMEKTPSNLMRIPYVHAIFPEARYLYLVRNPLDQFSSAEIEWQTSISLGKLWARLRETPKTQLPFYAQRLLADLYLKKVLKRRYVSVWGIRYPGIFEDLETLGTQRVIARQWVVSSEQAEADLREIDPQCVLSARYEDIVADPVPQFERILAHFGLDNPPLVARQVAEIARPNPVKKWMRMDRSILEQWLEIAGPKMADYGYEVPDLDRISEAQRVEAAESSKITTHGRDGFRKPV